MIQQESTGPVWMIVMKLIKKRDSCFLAIYSWQMPSHQQHFFVISSTFFVTSSTFLSPTALSDDRYLAFCINNNCTVRLMVIGRSQFNHISNLWQTLTMTVIILVCVVFSGCVILCLAWSCSKCWKGSFLRKSTMHLHLHNLECVVGRGTRMSN